MKDQNDDKEFLEALDFSFAASASNSRQNEETVRSGSRNDTAIFDRN
jgi:hypothetical protein